MSTVSYGRSAEIATALRAALNNGGFWVQAAERDGLEDERLIVSFGGDDGDWFTLTAHFDLEDDKEVK